MVALLRPHAQKYGPNLRELCTERKHYIQLKFLCQILDIFIATSNFSPALPCAMLQSWIRILIVAGFFVCAGMPFRSAQGLSLRVQPPSSSFPLTLRAARSSPSDLEIGGELAGTPPGTTRYLTRDDLLALPQVSYTVTDDVNFTGATQISGVFLEDLLRRLSVSAESDMVVAICSDRYHANYPKEYIAEHHPLLVLQINGQPPADWPKDSEVHRYDMGPFLISHPKFTPSFKIFSHSDEPQIPWGVVRLEFRDEKAVFASIEPRNLGAGDELLQAGFRIAQQNCFRCHNMGSEGGTKAGRPWLALSALANASPDYFVAYVRDPKSKNPHAQMHGNPDYDDKTIAALVAYFKTFSAPSGKSGLGKTGLEKSGLQEKPGQGK
jgi:mono/diheme cytochrome c family protein